MESDLIKLALKQLQCNQKQLAERLNVSPTQVSKWKNGEHMSYEMRQQLEGMLQLDGLQASVILAAGSLHDAKKWDKLIRYLAESANDAAETGYDTKPLVEETEYLCNQVFLTLRAMGVVIPKTFPEELEIVLHPVDESLEDEAYEAQWDAVFGSIEDNPYSNLIRNIFLSLNDVYGFYAAYICEFAFVNEDSELNDLAWQVEDSLMDLAACKLGTEQLALAKDFSSFHHATIQFYEHLLNTIKTKAFQNGLPLRAELLDMVYQDSGSLGHDAERESLGFNKHQIHPDIYMNELLTGMRIIHQVLPEIFKKLEIDFVLDESQLRL